MDKHSEIRKKLLLKYGINGQLIKLKEEMKELIKEIDESVYFEGYNLDRLKDEYIDVLNVALGLKNTLFLTNDEFDQHMDKKVEKAVKNYL